MATEKPAAEKPDLAAARRSLRTTFGFADFRPASMAKFFLAVIRRHLGRSP